MKRPTLSAGAVRAGVERAGRDVAASTPGTGDPPRQTYMSAAYVRGWLEAVEQCTGRRPTYAEIPFNERFDVTTGTYLK